MSVSWKPKSILGKRGKKKLRSRRNMHEMQALLEKLKEIVPIMPQDRQLSKLEIIHYVIEYIEELESALESRPVQSNPLSNCPRQPLGVICNPSNASIVPSTSAYQEASHVEKEQRPVLPSKLSK